jgi:hypothetical protein
MRAKVRVVEGGIAQLANHNEVGVQESKSTETKDSAPNSNATTTEARARKVTGFTNAHHLLYQNPLSKQVHKSEIKYTNQKSEI